MARPKKQIKDIKFTLRMPPPMYTAVQEIATLSDEAMNAVIVGAVARELARRRRISESAKLVKDVSAVLMGKEA